jgi:single-strand DNA-binding protein
MFGDLNQAEIIGNITNDINVRYTPNGKAVCSFGLATNRRYRNGPGEEWKEEVTFHNIVVWGSEAEGLAQRAKKGTRVYIQGRLQTRTWDDKDGKKNYKTEIVSEKMILLDRFERGQMEGSAGAGSNGGGSSAPRQQASKAAPVEENFDNGEINPDDLPF